MTTSNGLTPDEIKTLRVGLRDYVDVRLDAMEHHAETVFSNIEKSIEVANKVLDIRLAAMNEFRATIADQSNSFITKVEYKADKNKSDSEIQALKDFKLVINSKASQRSLTFAYVVSSIGLFISIISFILALIDAIKVP